MRKEYKMVAVQTRRQMITTKQVWYYVRARDGLVQYAHSGGLVQSQRLAACILDRPELWHAVVVREFPQPLRED